MPRRVCFLHYREPLILVWCGIWPRCRHVCPLLGSSRSSRKSGEWKKASHSLSSSFRDCWVWWQLRPTWYLLACCTWDPYSGGSRPRGSPRGEPASHDQGHAAVPTCFRHVETTLVLVSGPGAGSSVSPRNASDGRVPHQLVAMNGHPARGLWRGHHLAWHINRLEMLAVFQALKHFLPDLRDHHVLVHTDNTAMVFYINHQGGLRSRPLYRLAHQILVWSQGKLLSQRAVYIPGHFNVGADILSRQGPWPGEWMLHTEVVKQIWRVFGQVQVDLFATQETAQCLLWYSLVHPAPLGLDAMVQTWPRLRLYTFPPIALLPGVLERVCRDGVRLLLVALFQPGRVWFSDLISLLDGSPWEIPCRRDLLSQAGGTLVHPCPELWKLWVWPLRGHSS